MHKPIAAGGQTRYQREDELTQALLAVEAAYGVSWHAWDIVRPNPSHRPLHDALRGRRARYCGSRHGHHGPQGGVWHSAFRGKPEPIEAVAAAHSPGSWCIADDACYARSSNNSGSSGIARASAVDCRRRSASSCRSSRSVERDEQTTCCTCDVWIVHRRVRHRCADHDSHSTRA